MRFAGTNLLDSMGLSKVLGSAMRPDDPMAAVGAIHERLLNGPGPGDGPETDYAAANPKGKPAMDVEMGMEAAEGWQGPGQPEVEMEMGESENWEGPERPEGSLDYYSQTPEGEPEMEMFSGAADKWQPEGHPEPDMEPDGDADDDMTDVEVEGLTIPQQEVTVPGLEIPAQRQSMGDFNAQPEQPQAQGDPMRDMLLKALMQRQAMSVARR